VNKIYEKAEKCGEKEFHEEGWSDLVILELLRSSIKWSGLGQKVEAVNM
jgi:hypothetical protein